MEREGEKRLSHFLKRPLFWIAVFVLIDVAFAGWMLSSADNTVSPLFAGLRSPTQGYTEVEHLAGNRLSFGELSNYFTALAEEKGAPYALEVLKRADIPFGIDMHLLAHVVGDILYRQQGFEGIKVCTEDFRNACSHSIVVGLLLEEGEGALSKIAEACRAAPGGSGAYTMCFHGLGHGVLAYADYNMPRAVAFCEKLGTPRYGYREFNECVGGTTMEILSGVHNPTAWQSAYKKYFKDDDPLYPCSSDFIPDHARDMCYVYITPHLFEAAGANLASPLPAHFARAFGYCDAIPKTETGNRNVCFGGFGKEFIVLAQGRDIRRIEELTKEQLAKVYDWCLFAPHEEGIAACIGHAVGSLYWGGENNRAAALRFCLVISGPAHQSQCYGDIIGNVGYYIKDQAYRKAFCAELPPQFGERCRVMLLDA